MEKLKKTLKKVYPKINIFLNDIKEIAEIIEAETSSWIIETEIYRYDNFDDLLKNEANPRTLTISSKNYSCERYTRLSISEHAAILDISTDDIIANGMFSKIDKILIGRKRNVLLIYLGFFAVAMAISTLAQIIVSVVIADDLVYKSLASLLAVVLFYRFVPRPKNRIFIFESQKATSFFERKKDDIFIAIIGAFLGAIAGSMITILVQHISGSK
jgi:hypothetical protein